MSYSFRIRVNRCSGTAIETDEREIAVPTDSEAISIVLRTSHEKPLKESEHYVLVGSGYGGEESASREGVRYQNALMVALAVSRIGVDFGFRAAKGFVTEYGLEMAKEERGVRALNNVHGLMVYETDPPPRFLAFHATPTVGAGRDAFVDYLHRAIQASPALSKREMIAFTLFNASFFQPTADTRFILLVMAIEALIEPVNRADETYQLVESLIEYTKSSSLAENEKHSVLGSLSWLRKESINQAGRRIVAERLGLEKKYEELSAPDYFAKCYRIRSNLVHGNEPFPSFEEVGSVSGTLEVFVSELLTRPYVPEEG